MRYRFLLLLAGAAAMCGCGDPAPRQAPGAAARPIKTFTTESLGAINKNFAGMSTADDHFEPGFPGAGPDRQNERFGRPKRQERHRHRRDQSPRVHAANGGRQGYLSDGPVAARAQQAADRTAGDFASGLRDGRSRLRPGAHGLRQLEKHSGRHEAGRAVLGCRRESLCRQLPAGSGGASRLSGLSIRRRVRSSSRCPKADCQTLKLSGLAFTVRFDNYPNVVFDALLKEYVQSSTQAAGITVALTLDGQNVGKYDIAPAWPARST